VQCRANRVKLIGKSTHRRASVYVDWCGVVDWGMELSGEQVVLRPPSAFRRTDWARLQRHFRDSEIAHLNGSRPVWYPRFVLRMMLRSDEQSDERYTFGVYDEADEFIGLIELYHVG